MNGKVSVSIETPLAPVSQVEAQAGQTLQQVHDRVNPKGYPMYGYVNDELRMSYRDEWEQPLNEGDQVRFVMMPMDGKVFKSILSIVVGVAFFAASVLLPPLAPILGPTGQAILGAGILAVGGIVVGLINTPRAGTGTFDNGAGGTTSPTYSIGAQSNSARIGQPIPRLYGRSLIYPDYASYPYKEFSSEQEYLYQLFCLGAGEYDIEEIRLGNVTIWEDGTGSTGVFEDVTVQIVEPGDPVTLFPANVYTSPLVGGIELTSGSSWSGGFPASPSGTVTTSIALDYVFPQGLWQQDTGTGGFVPVTVAIQAESRLIDNAGAPLGSWTALGTDTTTNGNPTPIRKTVNYSVTSGRYEVRVKRTSDENPDTIVGDSAVWASMRGFIPDDQTFPDVTLVAIKIKASNQLSQGSDRKFNVIATSKLPIYDDDTETWSAPTATTNPAWILADILRNTAYGAKVPASKLNLASFVEFADTCTTRGDEFNGVFDTKRTIYDALQAVASVGNAQVVQKMGIYDIIIDQARTVPVAVCNPRTIRLDSYSRTLAVNDASKPDHVIVEYIDEDTWQNAEVSCVVTGSSSDEPARVQAFGITNRNQAFRYGIRLAATNKYRRMVHSFELEMEGRLLSVGDLIIVDHDMDTGRTSGDIVARDGLTLTSDEPLDFGEVTTAYLLVRDNIGGEFGYIAVTKGTTPYTMVMDNTSLTTVQTAKGKTLASFLQTGLDDERTHFTLYQTTGQQRRCVVLGINYNDLYSVRVDAINEDDRVHSAEEQTVPTAPVPYGAGLVPERPTIGTVQITQDPSSVTEPYIVRVAWPPSAGADYYVVQASQDGGTSWFTVNQGVLTNAVYTAWSGSTQARVRGIGLLPSEWAYSSQLYLGTGILLDIDGEALVDLDGNALLGA